MPDVIVSIPILMGFIGLGIVAYFRWWVRKQDPGTKRMQEVASWIKIGAKAFIKREFITIWYFIIGISVFLGILSALNILAWQIVIGFIVGSLLSLGAAFLGMLTATDANVRTANAARSDARRALIIAIRGGAVTGISVVSLSLLGVSLLYALFGSPLLVVGFGFGASLAALFAQLGGGIYTKSADVGADLVGKVEKRIEEDDPRNAAVIADLVGDNVGDCAGRGADLFESFSDNLISMMIVGMFLVGFGYIFKPIFPIKNMINVIVYPLMLQVIGLIGAVIGASLIGYVGKDPGKSIYVGFGITGLVVIIGFYPVTIYLIGDIVFWYCAILGLIASLIAALIVWYYINPKARAVKDAAEKAKAGPALNILAGTAWGMESSFPTAIVIAGLIALAYFIAGGGIKGIYGVIVAALGVLSTTGIIMSADAFGPITDNADGIAEMSGISGEVGETTEVLDAVGNMTKALTKGYGMCSALSTAIGMLFAYIAEAIRLLYEEGALKAGGEYVIESFKDMLMVALINIIHPYVIVGAMIGAAVPFLFTAWTVRGTARGAFEVVNEVRRQFDEKPEILEGKALPDYGRAVDIATKHALTEMIAPTLLSIVTPIIVGIIFGVWVLAAYLITLNIVAALLALFQFNAGGILDNAKKYVELMGLKRTDTHAAAVIGDTFGDPLKDASGPSLHILIKLSNILGITLLPLFAKYALLFAIL